MINEAVPQSTTILVPPEELRAKLTYISLGWGVQSFTLAAMVALGELPPVSAAIHADTTHERSETYAFAMAWEGWLTKRGVTVVTVGNYERAREVYNAKLERADIPAFTLSDKGKPGSLNRQCTQEWKIKPVRRFISESIKSIGLTKTPGLVEQWLGISLDEFQRMKDSDVAYISNRWPLIEKKMTRADCVTWLTKNGLAVPPKSSCVFCPFHNAAAWRELKQNPTDWDKAVAVDEAIRKIRPIGGDLFVHTKRIPLASVDMRTPQDMGQLELYSEECSGVCFV